MTHRAESIVAKVVTTVTGLTTTGTRVYRGRALPVQSTEYPCLLVYQGGDETTAHHSQDKLDSLLSVFIEMHARSPTAQLDTTLNTLREEVTVALQADYTQGLAYVIDTREIGAGAPEIIADGTQPVGLLRMEWRFHYRRSRTNPGA